MVRVRARGARVRGNGAGVQLAMKACGGDSLPLFPDFVPPGVAAWEHRQDSV